MLFGSPAAVAIEPYRSARRVFWIVDNGSSHRGERAAEELRARQPRVVLIQTPTHASWLNQADPYSTLTARFDATDRRLPDQASLADARLASHQDGAAAPVGELVTPYLEDVIPADERALVDQHLAGCDGCQTYVQQMRLTIQAIGHVSDEAITSQTREQVLAMFRAWRDGHADA